MKKLVSYLAIAILIVMGISACSKKARIIPKNKMSLIYADMFVADQWISDHSELFASTDSTSFYESIFNKYGYTSTDFIASVEKYIEDPERFNRIVKKSYEMLLDKKKHYEKERDEALIKENTKTDE